MDLTHHHTASKCYLLGLFILSLPLLMLLRWDASTWLTEKVDAAATSAGFNLSYSHVAFTGLGLRFLDVKLSQADTASVTLDALAASLSVSSLFSGHLGVDVAATWLANPVSFTVIQQEDSLIFSSLEADIDLLNLFELQQSLPLRVTGKISATGGLSVHKDSLIPQSGAINITWSEAEAGLAAPEFQLGDYSLNLKSNEEGQKQWQWNIEGGAGVEIGGKGVIVLQGTDIQQSIINGTLDIKVDPSQATLAMMVQAFAGASHAKLRVSGTLSSPRTHLIR